MSKKFMPHCAITCSGCAKVMNKRGQPEDLGGMSPFLYRKAAVFDTSVAAREFAERHGWKSNAQYNEDFCPECTAPKGTATAGAEAAERERAQCEA